MDEFLDQTQIRTMHRLQVAANTINQTILYGGSRTRLVQYNRLAFAVQEVNEHIVRGAAEIMSSSTGDAGMQDTHDLVSLWASELESAAAMPLDLVEEKRLKSLLRCMKNILEGHAKTMCTRFQRRGTGMTRDAIHYYGAMHLPMWDKAVAIVCEALQASRKAHAEDVYRAMRLAAGLEGLQTQEPSDEDYYDLNESDHDDWC